MSETPLGERLEALAAFVPVFEAPGFNFGEWHSPPGQMPWFSLSADANRFVSTAAQFGWINPAINWPDWHKTDEARLLLENPDAIADATVDDLEHLLTTHIRADRFVEGYLASAFDNGQLPAIARRAAALLHHSKRTE